MRIGFRQEQHVADMQDPGEQEPRQCGRLDHREEEREREPHRAFGKRQHQHEGETVVARLHQRVPGRVHRRRAQNRHEYDAVHAPRSLPAPS